MKTINVTTPTKGFEGWLVTNPQQDVNIIPWYQLVSSGRFRVFRALEVSRQEPSPHLLVGGILV